MNTNERVVAALTAGPHSGSVLRAGADIAADAGGGLMCLHVLSGKRLSGASVAAIGTLRAAAESHGASFHLVVADDVEMAIANFARDVGASRLVVGTTERTGRTIFARADLASRLMHRCSPIGVHAVVRTRRMSDISARGPRSTPRPRIGAWLLAVVVPFLATVPGILGWPDEGHSTDVMFLLLAVVIVALAGGLGPALMAAFVAAMLFNYFLTHPRHTFVIADRENVIALALLILVAVLVAMVVDRATRLAVQATQARTEATLLAGFAPGLQMDTDMVPRLLERVREAFGLRSLALAELRDKTWQVVARAGHAESHEGESAYDIGIDADSRLEATGRPVGESEQRVLGAVARQALLVIRNQSLAAAAAEAHRRAERTELGTALLSAVGHDLRTPLTSIKAAVGSLREPGPQLSTADRRELLAAVEESADRLSSLVDNLLDSSRIATGSITPLRQAIGYGDAVASALATMDVRHQIFVDLDDKLPEVSADAGLLERVIVNVVDNAFRHGKGAGVTIRGHAVGDHAMLRVADSGPGLPAERAGLFTPFQRLGDRGTAGIGLGLSVVRGFTSAMEGRVTVEDTPGGGLTVVISLPLAPAPGVAEQ